MIEPNIVSYLDINKLEVFEDRDLNGLLQQRTQLENSLLVLDIRQYLEMNIYFFKVGC